MKAYDDVLIGYLIGDIFVCILAIAFAIVGLFLIRKFDLAKYLYVLCFIALVASIFPIKESAEIIHDLKTESYVEYNGKFEQYNSTCKLLEDGNLKLQTKKFYYENGTYYGTIIYSEKSHILVCMDKLE